jgi:hypothetical protein
VARFLDDVLRLLKRLSEPSTWADHAAGQIADRGSLDALVESHDFRVISPLLPLFATGDARSRQAAQAIALHRDRLPGVPPCQAYADGGPATVGNIQLRCRTHDLYEAALLFDEGHFVREVGLNWL